MATAYPPRWPSEHDFLDAIQFGAVGRDTKISTGYPEASQADVRSLQPMHPATSPSPPVMQQQAEGNTVEQPLATEKFPSSAQLAQQAPSPASSPPTEKVAGSPDATPVGMPIVANGSNPIFAALEPNQYEAPKCSHSPFPIPSTSFRSDSAGVALPSSAFPIPSPSRGIAPQPSRPRIIRQPQAKPGEEICIECSMRDQDMAEVDVTSPGIWDRDSDVFYHELIEQERREGILGLPLPPEEEPSSQSSHQKPRAWGDPLTESHLKTWTTMNPREPTARMQTLMSYVKTQSALLEADALERARAVKEARHLESRMRDAYSQLRRSTYDVGGSAIAAKADTGGVRINVSRSLSGPSGASPVSDGRRDPSQSREVTLLENGMILERVDIKKEEKEERDRRRKDERRERSRARKSSRGSAADVLSIYSVVPSPQPDVPTFALAPSSPHPEGGLYAASRSVRSFYSASSSGRPMSIATAPITPSQSRPHLPRIPSQYSVDTSSVISGNRPRFRNFRNWSPGWRSSSTLGASGSMVDMHLALDQEKDLPDIPANLDGMTLNAYGSDYWQPIKEVEQDDRSIVTATQKPVKVKGIRKVLKFLGGNKSKGLSRKGSQISGVATFKSGNDPSNLDPPPSLAYLTSRAPAAVRTQRRLSSASYSSRSPVTSTSNVFPSASMPTSAASSAWQAANGSHSRFLSGDASNSAVDLSVQRGLPYGQSDSNLLRNSHYNGPTSDTARISTHSRPVSLYSVDKSLPPLPSEPLPVPRQTTFSGLPPRPQTVVTYGSGVDFPSDANSLRAPSAPFRSDAPRRQSFSGVESRVTMPHLHQAPMHSVQANRSFSKLPPSTDVMFGEFGSGQPSPPAHARIEVKTPAKRKSLFGLNLSFGKKKAESEATSAPVNLPSGHTETSGGSGSEGRHDTNQTLRVLSRMSIASRKAVEERVEQDPEFVAYRYPSGDQQFDLRR